jgi:hypothetical protein
MNHSSYLSHSVTPCHWNAVSNSTSTKTAITRYNNYENTRNHTNSFILQNFFVGFLACVCALTCRRGGWGFKHPPPPRNSEVLPKLSRIPSSVEYTSITTFANWVEPLTKGLPPPDLRSVCPLSSTEFVEPPPPSEKISGVPSTTRKKFLGTPLC